MGRVVFIFVMDPLSKFHPKADKCVTKLNVRSPLYLCHIHYLPLGKIFGHPCCPALSN